MKKQIILLMLVVSLLFGVIGCGTVEEDDTTQAVSYAEIITYPERYNGKELSVYGVLKKEEEGYCLYYSRSAAKYVSPIDSIWLGDLGEAATERELKEWNTWYVEVTGTLDMEKRGPDDAYSSGMNVNKIKKMKIKEDRKQYDHLLHYDTNVEFD